MSKKPVFMPPAQELRRKAVNFKKGFRLKLEPEEIKKLEAVVEKATDQFTVEVADKLRSLRVALNDVANSQIGADQAMQAIRSISLEIKGMGGMFKYPLLTAFAKSLNDFTKEMGVPTPIQLDIIAAQIDALYVVMANRIQGSGSKIEMELLRALEEAARKYKHH
jgi:chemotaxis protein histidine kinase CheA